MAKVLTGVRCLPGVVIAVACVGVLVVTGTGWRATALYALASAWSVLLPGMLVSRAVRGRPRTLVADLSLGFATGLVVQFAAWFAFTALGAGRFLALWPVVVIVVCLAVGPLRRKVWSVAPYERRLNPVTAWASVAVFLPAIFAMVNTFAWTGLPPSRWYPDMYWHIGITHELMRSVMPMAPQVLGEPLAYHWFANAHFAAMALTTGIDPILVVGRLWMPVFSVLPLGLLLTAADTLVGRAWPGVVAAALMFTDSQLRLSRWFGMPGMESTIFLSPSHQFALLLMIFVIEAITPALRGRPMGWRWVTAILGTALLGGSKSSAGPVLVCGALLVVLVSLIGRRPIRQQLKALCLVLLGVVGVTVPLAGTSSAGSVIQVFATVGTSTPWEVQFGRVDIATFHNRILAGLHEPEKLLFVALILLLYVIAFAWLAPAWGVLRSGDGAAWFLIGIGISGFVAMMTINHEGRSQFYFLRGAMVALCLLAAMGVHDVMTRRVSRSVSRPWSVALAGAGWGSAVVCAAQWAGGPLPPSGAALGSVLWSIGTCVVLSAVTLGAAAVALRRGRLWVVPALVGLAVGAAVLPMLPGFNGAAVTGPVGVGISLTVVLLGIVLTKMPTVRLRTGAPLTVAVTSVLAVVAAVLLVLPATGYSDNLAAKRASGKTYVLSAAEMDAAKWISRNTGQFDVVATNAHCFTGKTKTHCDARSFWVSGLGGRRVLVEGWTYTVAARKAHGRDGFSYYNQPFADQERLALNDSAFANPTSATLEALYGLGVRYLLADERSSTVEWSTLDSLAERVYGNPGSKGVGVYRLRTPA